jgi:cytochrome P450
VLEEMDIGFQKQSSFGCYVVSDNPYGTRLAAEGEEHGRQCKTLVPDFSTRSIKALSPIFSEKSLLLADPWQDGMKGKKLAAKPFEVLEWLSRATLGIIGKAGLGYDIDSLEHLETPIRIAYRLMFSFDFWSHAFITDQDESRYGPCVGHRSGTPVPQAFWQGARGFAACSARMNSGATTRPPSRKH